MFLDSLKTVEEMKPVMYEAGKMAMKYFKQVKIEQKADKSYVTEADREIERFIQTEIHKRYPDHFFYGEETGTFNAENTEYVWSCDPIDGTAPFVYELPVWCVSLGLIQKDRNILGFVYLPATDEMYWAADGHGAYCNDQRIHVHKAYDLTQKDSCILIPSKVPHEYEIEYNGRMLALGSAAANLAITAKGRIHGALQDPIRLYDICGGTVILQEAGGVMRYITNGEDVNLWDLLDGRKAPEPYFCGIEDNVEQLRKLFRLRS
jgi:myo-inositol-1(or 4)-monophosphatase